MSLLSAVTVGPVPAAAAPDRPLAAPRASAAALEAARRFLCPNGGAPTRGGLRQRGRCRGGAGAGQGRGFADAAGDAAGWDAGLAPAGGRQQACPPGTVAAPALARPEAVRCRPD